MEKPTPHTSSTEHAYVVHTRNIPDVQKDTEFIMAHLNDPNFDLSRLPSSISVLEEETTERYVGVDDSTSGASDVIFEKSSSFYLSLLNISNNTLQRVAIS